MLQVKSLTKRLKSSIDKLGRAAQDKNWAMMSELDGEAQALIHEALTAEQPLNDLEHTLLNDLHLVYLQLIEVCKQERSQIQKELLESMSRQQSLKSYQSQTDR